MIPSVISRPACLEEDHPRSLVPLFSEEEEEEEREARSMNVLVATNVIHAHAMEKAMVASTLDSSTISSSCQSDQIEQIVARQKASSE